jgi:hypothetical protein
MTDHPTDPRDIAALLNAHASEWQIEHDTELGVWTAVRRSPDGRHVRVLVGRDPAALREKIEDAEDEPGPLPGPGIAHPGGGWISGPSLPPLDGRPPPHTGEGPGGW